MVAPQGPPVARRSVLNIAQLTELRLEKFSFIQEPLEPFHVMIVFTQIKTLKNNINLKDNSECVSFEESVAAACLYMTQQLSGSTTQLLLTS